MQKKQLNLISPVIFTITHVLGAAALLVASLISFNKQSGLDQIATIIIGAFGALMLLFSIYMRSQLSDAITNRSTSGAHSLSGKILGFSIFGLIAAIGLPIVSTHQQLWWTVLGVIPAFIISLIDKLNCFTDADSLESSSELTDQLEKVLKDEPNLRDPRKTIAARQAEAETKERERLSRTSPERLERQDLKKAEEAARIEGKNSKSGGSKRIDL